MIPRRCWRSWGDKTGVHTAPLRRITQSCRKMGPCCNVGISDSKVLIFVDRVTMHRARKWATVSDVASSGASITLCVSLRWAGCYGSRSARRKILPAALVGSEAWKVRRRGILYVDNRMRQKASSSSSCT